MKPEKNNDDGVILVATGESGIFTSTDGATWTKREYEGYNAWHHRAVSGNGNGFVVGGDWGAAGLVTSDDGIKWTAKSLTGSGIYDIVWNRAKKNICCGGTRRRRSNKMVK